MENDETVLCTSHSTDQKTPFSPTHTTPPLQIPMANSAMHKGLAAASMTVIEPMVPTAPANDPFATKYGSTVRETAICSSDEVRHVSIHEYKEAAHALAEAFKHDEVARYFIDTPDRTHWNEQQKWGLHCQIIEYITYAHCLKGLVTTVGPEYGGVALWQVKLLDDVNGHANCALSRMPPGKNMDDFVTIFRSGMWRLNYKLSAEGKQRFFSEFLPLLHESKHSALGGRDSDSWYLVYIGCRPSARGKGYARKLIDHVTCMADREGRACYLESSNDINPKIYGRMGFEIKKKIYLQRAEDPIVLDLMVREPRMSKEDKASESRTEKV